METEISVVIPVYQAENIVPELIKQLTNALNQLSVSYEIILVEDFSKDNSWLAIEKECAKNISIKGIKLSRNFGQHSAIYAGLCNTVGNWIIVMDCDLQDNPLEIINLYNKAKAGFDIVVAEREMRKHSWLKRTTSKFFYAVLAYLTGIEQNHKVGNFGIYHQNVIKATLQMNDYRKYFPAMITWVGFKKTSVKVEHNARFEGETTYNYIKLFGLAMNTLLSFSDRPLRLVIGLGSIISTLTVISALVMAIRYYLGEIEVPGYASLILSIWFLSGIVITVLGVIGLYIGKIFDQGKARPVYLVEKEINV